MYKLQINTLWDSFLLKRNDYLLGFSFFCIYVLAAQFGLSLATLNNQVSPIWPATGIAMSILMLYGTRFLPAISLGAFVVNYFVSHDVFSSIIIMIGNSLEALIGCLVILRFTKIKITYVNKSKMTLIGIFFASIIATISSAAIGTLAIVGPKNLFSSSGFDLFLTWWTGDMVGGLVFCPFMVWFLNTSPHRYFSKKILPFTSFLLLTYFFIRELFTNDQIALFLFVTHIFIYTAIRFFNRLYSKIFIFYLSLLFITFSFTSKPLFLDKTLNSSLIKIQFLIAVLGITHLALSAIKWNRSSRFAPSILLIAWFLCGGLYLHTKNTNDHHEVLRFQSDIASIEDKINERMRVYEDALLGGKSFFKASNNFNEKSWKSYVDTLQIVTKYPGINGIGVIYSFKNESESSYLRKIRSEIPEFKIKSVPNVNAPQGTDDKFVITYIIPFAPNKQARGLDVGSEFNRRKAAEFSRDSGESAITEPIILVQDFTKKPGFLLYVPIYSTESTPPTIEERRRNFIGWIYAPFVSENFFKGIFKESEYQINLDIYQGADISQAKLVYQSSKSNSANNNQTSPAYDSVTHLKIGKSDFSLGWSKKQTFFNEQHQDVFWIFIFGSLFSLLMYLMVYSFENTGINAQAIADKQTELLLKETEKAISATKVKSEFLANMSHEIRTPLNGIVGMINLLLQSNLQPNDMNKVKIVSNSCETLLNLIDDILNFSKLEAKKVELLLEPLNLHSILSDIMNLFTPKAEEKNLILSLIYKGDSSEWYLSDSLRLKQILSNLIGNALKFTSQGGVSIIVSIIKTSDDESLIEIEIKDTGIGIKKESIQKLFASFSQADASSTKNFGGTGLGLSICKGLIELLGGNIWVKSELGYGSSFIFNFKAKHSPPAISSLPAAKSHSYLNLNQDENTPEIRKIKQNLSILIVDDNSINLKVAQMTINKLGYDCDLADSGKQALKMFESKNYDLIFMDCYMPELDGFSVTEKIRNKTNSQIFPRIVALTASIMKEDREKCFKSGMNSVIIKPIKIDFVNNEIKSALINSQNQIEKPAFQNSIQTVELSLPFTKSTNSNIENSLFDRKALFDHFGDDNDILIDSIQSFCSQYQAELDELGTLIQNRHFEKINLRAHSLKSVVSNFFSIEVKSLLAEIELMGRNKSDAQLDTKYSQLKALIKQLAHQLDELKNELNVSTQNPKRESA